MKKISLYIVFMLFVILIACAPTISDDVIVIDDDAVNTAVWMTLKAKTRTTSAHFPQSTSLNSPATISVIETPAPPIPDHIVDIYETGASERILEVSKIHARNCGSDNTITFSESVSKSITQDMTFDVALDLEAEFQTKFEIPLIASLELKYSITKGETVTKTSGVSIEVKPNTYLEYRIVWKEIGAEGYVVIERTNKTQYSIPYKVKQSLQPELLDPVDIGCN